jgi:DNA-binding FadR family transcriptional regulator
MNKLINQYDELAGGKALLEVGPQLSGADVLRRLIAKGQYAPGDRLPSERQLIEALGLRRNALRKALDELEFEGAIWRHVGKGTFVSAQSDAKGTRIADDIGRKMTPIRMVQARLCIEPALAKEAAIHASSGAIERMRQAVFASREATTWPEYEKQDGFFHRAVAEASDNILLFDQFNEVRKVVVGDTVVRDTSRPTETHKSFVEHDNILAAVERRDPQGAYDEMKKHIGSVASRLFGEL